MYTCLIIDDEELARELIENHLDQLDNFKIIASCQSAIEASKILQKQKIDLLFLDIEMPVLKGTDFFKNLINKPKVIFTTAYRDFAMEGFELNAVDFLLKPITFSRFFKAIEKFLIIQKNQILPVPKSISKVTDFIYIKKDRKQIKVYFDTILYIKSEKDYICIHCNDIKHLIKYSLITFHQLLDKRFIQIHRSYIINSDKITAFTKQDIEINKIEIPIGNSFKHVITKIRQQAFT